MKESFNQYSVFNSRGYNLAKTLFAMKSVRHQSPKWCIRFHGSLSMLWLISSRRNVFSFGWDCAGRSHRVWKENAPHPHTTGTFSSSHCCPLQPTPKSVHLWHFPPTVNTGQSNKTLHLLFLQTRTTSSSLLVCGNCYLENGGGGGGE